VGAGPVPRNPVDDRDLLQPTLAGRDERPQDRPRPWRLTSQVYPAFLGGPLAVGGIAVLNSFWLRLPVPTRIAIGALAVIAEAALTAVVYTADLGSAARLASAFAGVAVYGAAHLLQRSADRVYHFHSTEDEPYASLFWPGLGAIVAARLVETLVLFGPR
jgi:hypothetical protein